MALRRRVSCARAWRAARVGDSQLASFRAGSHVTQDDTDETARLCPKAERDRLQCPVGLTVEFSGVQVLRMAANAMLEIGENATTLQHKF